MRRFAAAAVVAGLLVASGCASPLRPGPAAGGRSPAATTTPSPDAPATTVARTAARTTAPPAAARLSPEPSPTCLEAIEEVAGRATGSRVLLGPAAFATSDELVLAPHFPRGADGRPLDGRTRAPPPVVFKLGMAGDECQIRQVDAAGSLPAEAGGSLSPAAPLSAAAKQAIALPDCRCRAR
jgi:hypothetical protein